jgi:hypothetical protein
VGPMVGAGRGTARSPPWLAPLFEKQTDSSSYYKLLDELGRVIVVSIFLNFFINGRKINLD